jgi:CRP-like cAMP-binding protein
LDEKPRSASAATVGTTELLVLSRDDLLTFVKSRPLVGLAMMRNLVERLRYTTDYLRLVTESIQKLSQGDYEQLAAQLQSTSSTDAEIQKMISAFIIMVQSVQERERALRRET